MQVRAWLQVPDMSNPEKKFTTGAAGKLTAARKLTVVGYKINGLAPILVERGFLKKPNC